MKRSTALILALASTLPLARARGQSRLTTIYSTANAFPSLLAEANDALYVLGDGPAGGECGAIYSLLPPAASGEGWAATLLYSFSATDDDACSPSSGLLQGPGGTFYGTTLLGGAYGTGTFYQLQPPNAPGEPWTDQVLYSFNSSPAGGKPVTGNPGGLLAGPGGSFYTLTDLGTYGAGALVQLVPPATAGTPWTGSVLHSFGAGYSPSAPDSLIAGPGGSLYGTSEYGGDSLSQAGTVFQLTPPDAPGGAWTETLLHSFGEGVACAGADDPAALALAGNGTLYGVAKGGMGCDSGVGAAFALSPPASPGGKWGYTILRTFDTIQPDSTIILRDGNLFFAAQSPVGGYILELRPPAAPGGSWTTTELYNYTNGQVPYGLLFMNEKGTLFGPTGALLGLGQVGTGTVYMITGTLP